VAITATFVGFKVLGIPGALIATVAIFLPSFLMLMLFMKVYKRVEHNRYVISFFGGTKAAVVAILFYTGIVFVTMNWLSIPYAVLGVGCLAALMFLRIEPFFLVLAGIIFSFIAR
jgi:chromate transporter